MLFDLGTGRKKRVVQAIYGLLALLFLVGFVGFGIGGEVGQGGIADIFTGGSDDIEETQFAEDGDELDKQLEADPRNEQLLVRLISTRYSAGNALMQTDEQTGIPQMTQEAEQQYEKAADAWDRYLELNPQRPSTSATTFAVSTFTVLAQNSTSETEADTNWKAAADAQELLVRTRSNVGTLSNLAFYSYAALDFKRGDRAAKQAEKLAANPAARKRISKQLDSYREQAKAYQAQRQAQEQQENQGQGDGDGAVDVPENPFGDVSSGGSGLSPTPTP